jgi:ubiquinone biosynthesis protein
VTLVQFVANAVVIGVLIFVLPGFKLHTDNELLALLWLTAVFGITSALVRPALEFLLLPYVLQSLGLVVIAINVALLALLGLTRTLEIKGVVPLLVGAVLAGVVGFLVESLLGLTPPVLDAPPGRAENHGDAVPIEGVSERLRLMQLYGILTQYIVDIAFDRGALGSFRRRMQSWLWRPPVAIVPLAPEVKVRLLLQDLGPTFVKIGQIVSSQGRALPPAWDEELAKLQSDVRPFAYEDVRAAVGSSLGEPPEMLYAWFDPTPLAAASLAQVHEATTHDGRRVAVKVQRPNIAPQLRSDIKILARGAAVLERRAAWADDANLTGMVHEFGTTLLRELDYSIEAYNARRLGDVLAPIEGVHVPEVVPELSSGRVLTLEYIDGVKSTDTDAIDAAGFDRHELARSFVRGAVQMVMIDGFFHADPHPGNVVVELGTGRLTFLDTGMVGQLDLSKRVTLARFLLAFRDKDADALATTLRQLSKPFREPNEAAYQRAFVQRIAPLLDPLPGRPVRLQKLVTEALDVLRSSGYQLDSEMTLAVKAVAQAEAITSALLPETGTSEFAELGGTALEELVPGAIDKDAVLGAARRQAVTAAGEIAERLPLLQRGALAWLDQLQTGQIPVSVRLPDLDQPLARFEAVPRLIAASVLLAGLIIGSALAATLDTGTSVFRTDLADVALVVLVGAMAMAVALLGALLWRLARPEPTRRRRNRLG